MQPFTYARAASAGDVTQALASGARPLAGGQTLLASMKLRLADPGALVDLAGVPGLAGIRREGERLIIGAMTRHADVAASPEVRAAIPVLADLAGGIGDAQVRAMGTLGGSVANNDPAACWPAGVLALAATVRTDRRAIPADDFFQGLFATALDEGEWITAIEFPRPRRAAYIKFRQPASRFALVGVFVAQTEGAVRVAVTGGGYGVFRHTGLEAALGARFAPEAVDGVPIDAADLGSDLHASATYRAHLIGVLTRRAVARALA